jgi:hypothetical protein
LHGSIPKLKTWVLGKVQKISLKGDFPLLTTFAFIPEKPVTNENNLENVLVQTFSEEGKKFVDDNFDVSHSQGQKKFIVLKKKVKQ